MKYTHPDQKHTVFVDAGLVERAVDPDDRRARLVVLTETGRRKVREAVDTHLDDLDAEVFLRLDPRGVAQLDRLLDRLREP